VLWWRLLAVASCPDGWHRYNDHCLYVSTNEEDQSAARSSCQTMSADLASISDQDEMDFVADISSLVTTVNVYNRLSVVVVCLFCSNDSICTIQVSGRGVGGTGSQHPGHLISTRGVPHGPLLSVLFVIFNKQSKCHFRTSLLVRRVHPVLTSSPLSYAYPPDICILTTSTLREGDSALLLLWKLLYSPNFRPHEGW